MKRAARSGEEAVKKLCVLGCLLFFAGCAPAVIGIGAAGVYGVATDERDLSQYWHDKRVTSRVKTELLQDPVTKARKIDVDTLEGIVTLTGVVETEPEAERAVEIARKVLGVKAVRNNLQIGKTSTGEFIDDSVLVTKINALLLKEPGIRSLNIDVDANKGVVTLNGIVKDDAQKRRVIEIAESVAGVERIVDYLKVKTP